EEKLEDELSAQQSLTTQAIAAEFRSETSSLYQAGSSLTALDRVESCACDACFASPVPDETGAVDVSAPELTMTQGDWTVSVAVTMGLWATGMLTVEGESSRRVPSVHRPLSGSSRTMTS